MSMRRDRRRTPRFPLSLGVRFLLDDAREGSGAFLNISETGAAVLTDVSAREGESVILYTNGLDMLTGRIARVFRGGFSVELALSKVQRESIGARIAAVLAGGRSLNLSEMREYSKRKTVNIDTTAQLDGADAFPCTLVNVSHSGCLIRAATSPPIGASLSIGALHGRVTRLGKNTFAVRFDQPVRSDMHAQERLTAPSQSID